MPAGFSSNPVEEDAVVFSAKYEKRLKNGTIKKITKYLPNTDKAYQAEVEMPSVATVFGSISGNTFTVSNENSVNLSVGQYVKQLTYDPLTRVGSVTNDDNPVISSAWPDIMAIDPLGRFLYVRTVIDSTTDGMYSSLIKTYVINRITSTLDIVQTIVLDTDYYVAITGMSVDVTGKFLFFTGISTGGVVDYVSTYSINQENGTLTFGFRTNLGTNLPKKLIIDPLGKFVYVMRSSNGLIIIKCFSINQSTGELTLCQTVTVTGLYIAYDLITTVDGKFLYVCGTSLTGTLVGGIKKFTINTSTGALTDVQDTSLSTFPTLMARSPDGKFLYVTTAEENNNYYRLITYSINQSTGALTENTYIQTDFYYRNILINKTGDYLICSYRNPNNYLIAYLVIYKIDKLTGGLTLHATEPISVLGGQPVEAKDFITIATSVADTSGSLIFSSCWRSALSGDVARNRILIHQINTEKTFKIVSINTSTVKGFSSYTINATVSVPFQYFLVYDNFLIGGTISGYLNAYNTSIIGELSYVFGSSIFITFADLQSFGISKQNEESMYGTLTSISISGLQYEFPLDTSKISLHIADSELTISSDDEYIFSEHIDLENYTIRSLIDFFATKYENKDSKILLKLADNASENILNLSATVLCEGSSSLQNGSVTWCRFTNQNYSLLTAFALIVKIYKKLVSGSLAQTDQRLATRDWLEYWGSLLGIPRESYEQFDEQTSEPDTAYRERMRRETMLPKSNNVAMAYLLSQATSRNITVSDGGQPFVLYSPSNSLLNTLPICVNNPTATGKITISGLTVTGVSSDLLNDFTSNNSSNSLVSPAYIIVEGKNLEGKILKLQVSSIQSATSLTVEEYENKAASGSITLSATPLTFATNDGLSANLAATIMTVVTHTSGKWSLGQVVSGGAINNGNVVRIVGFLSGTGEEGTYAVEQSSAQSITVATNVTAIMSISNSLFKTAGRSHDSIPALTVPSAIEEFLGPSTGGGAFSVHIPRLPTESDIPQSLFSFVSRLANKYKPAGIPFTIN